MQLMDKPLPILCDSHCCTACSACVNSCKHDAIKMMEDERGELHPVIDKGKCIRCGLCEKVCPELFNNSPCKYDKPEVYYCWLKSIKSRKQSTSGGAGYAIACAVVKKGGHVWGAAYDENMTVRYIEADTVEDLSAIQKSKYVQSIVGNCYQQIKEELQRGELVLFPGTSCHVKGLRSYLRKDYPNLLTVDLICHGVPGYGIFKKYKEWLEQKYNDRMIYFDFRPKGRSGQEKGYCSQATFANLGNKTIEGKDNSYYVGFSRGIFLRNSCYQCSCKGEYRYADITIGDFWGLGKVSPFHNNRQRPYGISMLALNSEKGKSFLEYIRNDMFVEKRTYEEASISNGAYYRSCRKPLSNDLFWREWNILSWEELSNKYFKLTNKDWLGYWIKKSFHPTILSGIKSLFNHIK